MWVIIERLFSDVLALTKSKYRECMAVEIGTGTGNVDLTSLLKGTDIQLPYKESFFKISALIGLIFTK